MRALCRFGIAAAFLFLIAVVSDAADIQAFHKAFGPRSTLRVSSPTVEWEIWPGPGGRITSASMQINGQAVSASYDERRRVLTYKPPSPLGAGSYKVDCRVVVDEQLVVTKDWSFQIAAEALPSLAPPSESQVAGLEAANRFRRLLGLPDMVMDARLNAASLAHSAYLSANKRRGHFEKDGEPQFAGRSPSERLESFGFLGGSWECVSAGISGVDTSTRDLFDAPYHRLPFMQPGVVLFGSGYAGERMTLNFGMSDLESTVVSPADGQSDVPLGWAAVETPNPLRLHGSVGPVGYPIMLAQFGVERIALKSAQLSCGTEIVPLYVNSPDNDDHLRNAVVLIPQKPLLPQTAYSAKVVISVGGREIAKSWTFRTGGAAPR